MKKIIFLTSFLMLLAYVSFSQGYELLKTMDFFRQNNLTNGVWKNTLSEDEIEGSPYLSKEFVNGEVYTVNKQKYQEIPLRFNIFNDAIEFKSTDGQIFAMDAPELIEKVEFSGNTLVYLPFSASKKIRKGYFIVLLEGTAALYLKPEIFFKDAVHPAAYQDAEPAKFIKKPDTYYIKIGVEQAKLVGNKNDLTDIFADKKEIIEAFIKKNKVKYNNPDDLKELIKYYNSL